ncbi:uncharacterized protein [Rutidosis leptorrhynchoides]|uniref:uncharacterized protein n=1 Tax=Rutidosis leptorrhynchoides TaxID=125765 RepID=UPI003A9A0A09
MKGEKSLTNINLGTKHKSMKVRAKKKKMNVVDKPVLDNLVDEPVFDEPVFYEPFSYKNIKKSPNVNNVPLTEEGKKSWVEFKQLAVWKPAGTDIDIKELDDNYLPINVDHPFVSFLHDFIIAAFNEVVHMYGENGKSGDNMSNSEVMSCKYKDFGCHFYFYMTIEAIERGKLGVHKVLVGCRHIDGSLTLVRKLHIKRTPKGNVAKNMPRLRDLISKYKTLKGMKIDKEIEIKLERAMKKDKDNHDEVAARFIKLKKELIDIEGNCNLLYREIRSIVPEGWSKRRVSSSLYRDLPNTYDTGLMFNGSGYDYNTRLMEFPYHALMY